MPPKKRVGGEPTPSQSLPRPPPASAGGDSQAHAVSEVVFVNTVPDLLRCESCRKPAIGAMQTVPCSHLFCLVCAEKKPTTCPVSGCGESIEDMHPDRRNQNAIAVLETKCSNTMNGCHWTGPFKELSTHLEKHCLHGANHPCPFQSEGCDFQSTEDGIASHCANSQAEHLVLLTKANTILREELKVMKSSATSHIFKIDGLKELRSGASTDTEAPVLLKGVGWKLRIGKSVENKVSVHLFSEKMTHVADFVLRILGNGKYQNSSSSSSSSNSVGCDATGSMVSVFGDWKSDFWAWGSSDFAAMEMVEARYVIGESLFVDVTILDVRRRVQQ